MILITGDSHGQIDFLKIRILNQRHILTRDDYLIIAGDFGGLWCKGSLEMDLEPYAELPFNVLFVDGNHENFDILNSYPVEVWNSGKIHRIKKNIIHLMRGQYFSIEGKSIFAFGGATSIDKGYREEHVSWWKEEVPSKEEVDEGKENLRKHGNKVDFIITHTIDDISLNNPALFFHGNRCKAFEDNIILNYFEEKVSYKHWYFGHYHIDKDITDKKSCLYNTIRELK